MPLLEELRILVDQLQSIPKVLQDLTNAIRDAAKGNRQEHDVDDKRPIEIRLNEDQERKREADSNKQVYVQRWIAAGTWGAFIAAAGYAGISLRQLQALKYQTTYAERAWVNANVIISGPLEYKDDGAHFLVAIDGQNLGHAPATDVQLISFVTSFVTPDYY